MEFECPVCLKQMLGPFVIKCGHTSCYSCLITQLKFVNSPKANCLLGCGDRYDLNDMVPLYAMIPAMNDGKEMTRCVKDLENRRKILPALSDKIDEEGKEFYYDYSDRVQTRTPEPEAFYSVQGGLLKSEDLKLYSRANDHYILERQRRRGKSPAVVPSIKN